VSSAISPRSNVSTKVLGRMYLYIIAMRSGSVVGAAVKMPSLLVVLSLLLLVQV